MKILKSRIRQIIKEFIEDDRKFDLSNNLFNKEEEEPSGEMALWCVKGYMDIDSYPPPRTNFSWFFDKESMINEISTEDAKIFIDGGGPPVNRVATLSRKSADPRDPAVHKFIKKKFKDGSIKSVVIYDHSNHELKRPNILIPDLTFGNYPFGYFYNKMPNVIRV